MNTRKCKICDSNTSVLFNDLILNKYNIYYYICQQCHFIQTEEPYWLNEAYTSAIGTQDIGLLSRNIYLREQLIKLLNILPIDLEGKFLDYGGGTGVFVRLMRDAGFDFYLYDKYCDNHFAKYFELIDLPTNTKFEALTSFEVFEHLENPYEEVNEMLEYSDIIIFSTELQPNIKFKDINDWWYFAPIGGQHIALYHKKSLEYMAQKLNLYFYSNQQNLHIFSKTEITNPFIELNNKSFISKVKNKIINTLMSTPPTRTSLLQRDVTYILNQRQ